MNYVVVGASTTFFADAPSTQWQYFRSTLLTNRWTKITIRCHYARSPSWLAIRVFSLLSVAVVSCAFLERGEISFRFRPTRCLLDGLFVSNLLCPKSSSLLLNGEGTTYHAASCIYTDRFSLTASFTAGRWDRDPLNIPQRKQAALGLGATPSVPIVNGTSGRVLVGIVDW